MANINQTQIGWMSQISRSQVISLLDLVRNDPEFYWVAHGGIKFTENQKQAYMAMFSDFLRKEVLSGDELVLSGWTAKADLPHSFRFSYRSDKPSESMVPYVQEDLHMFGVSVYLDNTLDYCISQTGNIENIKPVMEMDYYPNWRSFRAFVSSPDGTIGSQYEPLSLAEGIQKCLAYIYRV